MLLGLTGRIGVGKSEVAEIMRREGAFIINADKIGKQVVDENQQVLKRSVRAFGEGIINSRGKLNRRKLGRVALACEENTRRLNEIVHPYLLTEMGRQVKAAIKREGLVVIDAALLIDWGWQKKVDMVILVHAPDRVCITRLRRKGYSIAEAKERLNSQLSYSELKKHAGIVITNCKSIEMLQVKVKKLLQGLV